LKDYLENKKAVIGVSGGVDSAVVVGLCCKAIGPHNVIGLIMPYTDQGESIGDAISVCDKYNVDKYDIVNITDSVSSVLEDLTHVVTNEMDNIGKGNIRARVRMINLYAYSNVFNGMVIGTGNKSEIAVGYFTKYGDGGVDIEPIGDIYKTEVFEMAKILGVPEKIINKPPSAELWDNQTDEDEIGMTYYFLDEILKLVHDPGFRDEDEEKARYTYGYVKVDRVLSLIKQNDHKKHTPPVFIIE